MGSFGSLDPHGHPGGVLIAEISLFQTFVLIFESKAASGNSVMIFKMSLGAPLFNLSAKSCKFLGF